MYANIYIYIYIYTPVYTYTLTYTFKGIRSNILFGPIHICVYKLDNVSICFGPHKSECV